MSIYHVKLDADVANVAAVASAINFEEAGSRKFVQNELAWASLAFTNLITFEKLSAGTLLPRVMVTIHPAPAPAAHTKVWSGAMSVAGKNELVDVWRATP